MKKLITTLPLVLFAGSISADIVLNPVHKANIGSTFGTKSITSHIGHISNSTGITTRTIVTGESVTGSWSQAFGSPYHVQGDKYAQDWNWSTQTSDDLGITLRTPFSGKVIRDIDCFSRTNSPKRSEHPEYKNNCGELKVNYGNEVVIQSLEDSRFFIRFAHLDTVAVNTGDIVTKGDTIGTLGGSTQTSESMASHLHLVVYRETESNPDNYELDKLLKTGYYMGYKSSYLKYAAPFDFDEQSWVEVIQDVVTIPANSQSKVRTLNTSPYYNEYLIFNDYLSQTPRTQDFDLIVSSTSQSASPTKESHTTSYCSPWKGPNVHEACFFRNPTFSKLYIYVTNTKNTSEVVTLKYYVKRS